MKNQKEIKQLKQLVLDNDLPTIEFINCEIIRLKNENINLENSLSNNIEKIKNEIQKNKMKLKTLIHNQRRLKQ